MHAAIDFFDRSGPNGFKLLINRDNHRFVWVSKSNRKKHQATTSLESSLQDGWRERNEEKAATHDTVNSLKKCRRIGRDLPVSS